MTGQVGENQNLEESYKTHDLLGQDCRNLFLLNSQIIRSIFVVRRQNREIFWCLHYTVSVRALGNLIVMAALKFQKTFARV